MLNRDAEKVYMCHYCGPLLKKYTIPAMCVLNGFSQNLYQTIDALSNQLIQRAKAFQTIVRLGTYSGKVPAYNALQACSFCHATEEYARHLSEVQIGGTELVALPDPQLYIIVNGVNKIVWQTLLDINAVKLAIKK